MQNSLGITQKQRGVVAVEMAIAVPLLLLLLLASAEMGRAFYQYNTLTKSVRDGARFLSENALTSAGAFDITNSTANAENLVVYGNALGTGDKLFPTMNTDDVSVSEDGIHVTVSASYVYQPIFGGSLPTFGLGNDIDTVFTFRATTSMRALN